jgi:hypothetical protein
MEEKDKLSGIANYLKESFPGCVTENMRDCKARRYLFRVDAPTGQTTHTIISSEFVSDDDSEDIVTCLNLYNLKGYLEIFGNKEVLVTEDKTQHGLRWVSPHSNQTTAMV